MRSRVLLERAMPAPAWIIGARRITASANLLDSMHVPYSYGGGHTVSPTKPTLGLGGTPPVGLDCSKLRLFRAPARRVQQTGDDLDVADELGRPRPGPAGHDLCEHLAHVPEDGPPLLRHRRVRAPRRRRRSGLVHGRPEPVVPCAVRRAPPAWAIARPRGPRVFAPEIRRHGRASPVGFTQTLRTSGTSAGGWVNQLSSRLGVPGRTS